MKTMTSIRLLVAAIILLPLAGGCGVQRETYVGHSPENVWTAMVAVAQTPDYNHPDFTERWIVRENHVWVDETNNRIEVFRRVERDLYKAGVKPRSETREWKLAMELERTDPPSVRFFSRGWGVPAHAWIEADRYFTEIWQVLGRSSTPAANQPAADASGSAAASDSADAASAEAGDSEQGQG